MAAIRDQDRFFSGDHASSTPQNLIPEASIARLINGRFLKGCISNGVGFDLVEFEFAAGNSTRIPFANISYGDLIRKGDIQFAAPLQNIAGKFWVFVIAGVLLKVDLSTNLAYDITPKDSFLTDKSMGAFPLSYLDNDGGVYGSGGYLVIFNYPNRPIFVNENDARVSNKTNYEMPPARLGATAGNRAFIIVGDNIVIASDPLGGASPLAPLTFQETLDTDTPGAYLGQYFSFGSVLDSAKVTCVTRMPRLLGPSQEFLAQNLLVQTKKHKYIVAAGSDRAGWDAPGSQFITYAGNSEGAAGPLASTNIGSTVVYIASTGRIKLLSQELEKETSLSETYFDAALGQYLCCRENDFHFRPWYQTLDHSRAQVKFNQNRLYATVYPYEAPAINKYGENVLSYSNRALAVGSMSDESRIGAQANIAWHGFYDWLNPVALAIIDTSFYIAAKSSAGLNSYYRENFLKTDEHSTTIYTRGYFSTVESPSKSLSYVTLFFKHLSGPVKVTICYLIDSEWVWGSSCIVSKKVTRFKMKDDLKTGDASIPIKIEIEHNGCRFELKSIRVKGEAHREEK